MTIPREWTSEDYLALWRRLFPRAYTRPMEQEREGEGLDMVAAQAAIFARVDEAIRETTQRYFLEPHTLQQSAPASLAAAASAVLQLTRTGDASYDVPLFTGTRVVVMYRDTRGEWREGLEFAVAEDTTLAAGDVGPIDLPVIGTRVGYLGNVGAGAISAFVLRGSATIEDATVVPSALTEVLNDGGVDRFTASQVGQFLAFRSGPNLGQTRRIDNVLGQVATVQGAALSAGVGDAEVLEFEDLGLVVTQPDAATGGLDAWLDAIGAERLIFRQLTESADAYRARIAQLPDVVSPLAIERILNGILTPAGIPWVLRETLDPDTLFGMVMDVSPLDTTRFWWAWPGGFYVPNVRFFVISVGITGAGESGFAMDAELEAGAPYIANALDAAEPAPPAGGMTNAYDGRPVDYLSAIAAAWAAVNRARAGGVGFVIALDPDL